MAADQLRVTVEMGDDFVPSPRVAKALDELAEALRAGDEEEVAGFRMEELKVTYRSWGFDSLGMGGTTTGPRAIDIKGEL